MPLTIRRKMILYTVIPVVVVFALMFALGLTQVRDHLNRNAQDRLFEHARHQASRLAVAMSQPPSLAASLGDLVIADPAQPDSLLYAHLIDGLRRTPLAQATAVEFGTPLRGAKMRRGADAAEALTGTPTLRRTPGWHIFDDRVGFSRPILRSGTPIGDTWVEAGIADIYASLEEQSNPEMHLIISHDKGALLAAAAPPRVAKVVAAAPPYPGHHPLQPTRTSGDGTDYWLVSARAPGHPWWITAVIPVETALAEARQGAMLFAAGLLLALAIIVLVISTVARQITRPLTTLNEAVQRVTAGDFMVAPEVRSNDELGGLARAIGRMGRHIADRENQLRGAYQVLEQRVAERTSALQQANARLIRQIEETRTTQEALRLANEKAQQANRAKSEFLSNMSHELRTPLHGVLGYAQILRRDTQTNQEQNESLGAIERCGQHLLTLINDILDLTKIEAGEMRVEMQATQLPQLIEDVCTIVGQRAAQKGLELHHELLGDLPEIILTDPLKLRQILLNLLGNAVKFTSHGSVVLTAGPVRDGLLPFQVADSGVGIPSEKIDAIFDAFQQASAGQATDGTGLGLAINQRLIRLLGGEPLSVESVPGEGSRFQFRIPCEPVSEAPETYGQQPAHPLPRQRLAPGQSCSVMVIDELAENRNVMATLFRQVGCDVETLGDRARARQRLGEKAFDVILLDVRLPNDGLGRLADEMKQQMAFCHPKLVAVSANVFADSAQQVVAAGFDAFLAKPFSDQQVLSLIEKLSSVRFINTADVCTADSGSQDWPPALARKTATRILSAVDMGDIGSLFQLAEELADEPGAPQTDVENIALMARMFDFDGLRKLSDHLHAAS